MLRPKSPVPPTSMKVDLFARLGMYTPVLLAILFMLPRLLLARFELFDDARTLITADKISRGIWYTYPDNMEGRFRPIHCFQHDRPGRHRGRDYFSCLRDHETPFPGNHRWFSFPLVWFGGGEFLYT
jgi:hypothetical protein